MKGLMNNEEAVNIVKRIDSMLDNRLHQIYNLGYRQGFKDGVNEAMQKMAEHILNERRTDDE